MSNDRPAKLKCSSFISRDSDIDVNRHCFFLFKDDWLVVQCAHLEKYEFVNGKDDIPYITENQKCSKPPTR